jgi:heptosyltransferase III
MRKRAAVFFHNGLGDGINCMVLSNNLHLNGFEVDTFRSVINSLKNCIPHLTIKPYPSIEEIPKILQSYDLFFAVWNDSSEFIIKLIQEGKRRFPEKMKVIYLYGSKNIVNERYYADCLTNSVASVAENMRIIVEKVLHLPKLTKNNGLIAPVGLTFKKYPKRVVIHSTSSRPTRNWPREKFVKLAMHLKKEGFQPVFMPGPEESSEWNEYLSQFNLECASFPNLDEVARFVYESGYFIGNDSGPGHLASFLGIPTMSLFRRKTWAKMWAPSFAENVVVAPSNLVPNIRGFRLRDRHWQKFITVNMARRGFERLIQTQPP